MRGFGCYGAEKRIVRECPLADIRVLNQLQMVSIRFLASRAILAGLFAALTGCDPGVHVAWKTDFTGSVDYDCIEQALRAVAPDVNRGSYQSDGNGPRGFERGVTVTQFGYSDPTLLGYYNLDVAEQKAGKTHYWHGWGKIGTEVSADEQRRIIPLLVRANRSVEQRCGLSFSRTVPAVGDG